jgi:hypothetical protein
MCTTIDFDGKIDIIKRADMEDAVILKQNYSKILGEITDQEPDKETYTILQKIVDERILELKNDRTRR